MLICWWRLLASEEGMLAVDFRLPKPRPLKREFREFSELIRKRMGEGLLKRGRERRGREGGRTNCRSGGQRQAEAESETERAREDLG